MENKKLYDLTMLKGFGDKDDLLDILSLLLVHTSADIAQLPLLAKEKKWSEVFKLAHKAKGSVSTIQATQIVQLLAIIEKNARDETCLTIIEEKITEVVVLFKEVEVQLRHEEALLRQKLS